TARPRPVGRGGRVRRPDAAASAPSPSPGRARCSACADVAAGAEHTHVGRVEASWAGRALAVDVVEFKWDAGRPAGLAPLAAFTEDRGPEPRPAAVVADRLLRVRRLPCVPSGTLVLGAASGPDDDVRAAGFSAQMRCGAAAAHIADVLQP